MTALTIDRRRAARALADFLTVAAAALPFVIGLTARLLWRLGLFVWIAVLWVIGAVLAGWDAGKGRR